MKPGCMGKFDTNNLPEPTDLTEIPTGFVFKLKDATQKSARMEPRGIVIQMVPREPIFEKCSHLREKGGC